MHDPSVPLRTHSRPLSPPMDHAVPCCMRVPWRAGRSRFLKVGVKRRPILDFMRTTEAFGKPAETYDYTCAYHMPPHTHNGRHRPVGYEMARDGSVASEGEGGNVPKIAWTDVQRMAWRWLGALIGHHPPSTSPKRRLFVQSKSYLCGHRAPKATKSRNASVPDLHQ
jgi:hypothetical protein